MKRTNVILDQSVLKEAVELTGEKTYSAVINRALAEMVRKLKLKRGLDWFANLKEDPFWPGYAEELFGEDWARRQREREKKSKGSIISDAPIKTEKPAAKGKRRGTR